MVVVAAVQPTSRRVKALRLRGPLMQRQVARRLERRQMEDEAWARVLEQEVQRKQQVGRPERSGRPERMGRTRRTGRNEQTDQTEGMERVERDAYEQEAEVEARLRQARNEERRKMMRRATETRPVASTGRRRNAQNATEGEPSVSKSRERQENEYVRQQYVKQRLAQKVGGFADIVAMTTKADPVQPAVKTVDRTRRRGRSSVRTNADTGQAQRRGRDENPAVRVENEEVWDF